MSYDFLLKPEGDGGRPMVVLLRGAPKDTVIQIVGLNGQVIGTGRYDKPYEGGYSIFRFDKKGPDYGQQFYVKADGGDFSLNQFVGNSSVRQEDSTMIPDGAGSLNPNGPSGDVSTLMQNPTGYGRTTFGAQDAVSSGFGPAGTMPGQQGLMSDLLMGLTASGTNFPGSPFQNVGAGANQLAKASQAAQAGNMFSGPMGAYLMNSILQSGNRAPGGMNFGLLAQLMGLSAQQYDPMGGLGSTNQFGASGNTGQYNPQTPGAGANQGGTNTSAVPPEEAASGSGSQSGSAKNKSTESQGSPSVNVGQVKEFVSLLDNEKQNANVGGKPGVLQRLAQMGLNEKQARRLVKRYEKENGEVTGGAKNSPFVSVQEYLPNYKAKTATMEPRKKSGVPTSAMGAQIDPGFSAPNANIPGQRNRFGGFDIGAAITGGAALGPMGLNAGFLGGQGSMNAPAGFGGVTPQQASDANGQAANAFGVNTYTDPYGQGTVIPASMNYNSLFFTPISTSNLPITQANLVDPLLSTARTGNFNTERMMAGVPVAQDMTLSMLANELMGLGSYVPGAAGIARSESLKDMGFNAAATGMANQINFSRLPQVSAVDMALMGPVNQFNQNQRTSLINQAVPGASKSIQEGMQRGSEYAQGKLLKTAEDRAYEMIGRSASADANAARGFGDNSVFGRQTSDMLSAERRLNLSQMGDTMVNNWLRTGASTVFEQPVKVNPLTASQSFSALSPSLSNAGSQVQVNPSVSPAQMSTNFLSSLMGLNTISPDAAISAQLNQSGNNASLLANRNNTIFSGDLQAQGANQAMQYDQMQTQISGNIANQMNIEAAAQNSLNSQSAMMAALLAWQFQQAALGQAQQNNMLGGLFQLGATALPFML
jgi:hypothetical protein